MTAIRHVIGIGVCNNVQTFSSYWNYSVDSVLDVRRSLVPPSKQSKIDDVSCCYKFFSLLAFNYFPPHVITHILVTRIAQCLQGTLLKYVSHTAHYRFQFFAHMLDNDIVTVRRLHNLINVMSDLLLGLFLVSVVPFKQSTVYFICQFFDKYLSITM